MSKKQKATQTGVPNQPIVGKSVGETRASLDRPLTPAEAGHAVSVSSGQKVEPSSEED